MNKKYWILFLGIFSACAAILDFIMIIENDVNKWINLVLFTLCAYYTGYWFDDYIKLKVNENDNTLYKH